jgi:hypothetical protein
MNLVRCSQRCDEYYRGSIDGALVLTLRPASK